MCFTDTNEEFVEVVKGGFILFLFWLRLFSADSDNNESDERGIETVSSWNSDSSDEFLD